MLKQRVPKRLTVEQGSRISRLLTNIYYNELDEYIETITKQYTTRMYRKKLNNPMPKSLQYTITKVYEQMRTDEPQSSKQRLANQLTYLRKQHLNTPSQKDKITRIEYVRYADHWMIGVAGPRLLAIKIKNNIKFFMKHILKQNLHPIKTSVSDLRSGNVHFLAYEIFLPKNRPMSNVKGKQVKKIRREQPQLRFDLPVTQIINRYAERGYVKKLTKAIRPISKASYTVLEDHVIVNHYRSLWLGLLNYYSGCTNRSRLQYIHTLLHMSCAMTLGHRHRISCSNVFKKYGKDLKTKISTGKTVTFPYKTTWRLNERKWLLGKKVIMPINRYANLISQHWDDWGEKNSKSAC